MTPSCVVAVGFEGVNAFDLMGPFEVFATANEMHGGDRYRLILAAPDTRPFRSESGLSLTPDMALGEVPSCDTIVIPGGAGIRVPATNRAIARWLGERIGATRRVASVCTGIYAFAATGALDGRMATTHWRFLADVARKFPAVNIVGARVFVRDGSLYTSGGVASGVDMALALVAEDFGAKFASTVAEHMVLHAIRGVGQVQVSSAMRAQAQAADRLSGLLAWIGANLDAPLDVEALAAQAALSTRQLHRLFCDQLGETPARYVLARRLDAARDLLAAGTTVEAAAAATGFASAVTFRRDFAREHGDAPTRHMAGIVG